MRYWILQNAILLPIDFEFITSLLPQGGELMMKSVTRTAAKARN